MSETYNKDQHIAQLEATNQALAAKLADMNKRMQTRHDLESLRWRNKTMYYRKKCLNYERVLKTHGLEYEVVKTAVKQ